MIPATRIPILYRCNGYYLRWYYNGWHYWQFFDGDMKYLTDGENYRTRGIRLVSLSSGVVTGEQIEAIRTILNTREVYMYTDAGWQVVRVDSGDAVVSRNTVNAYELQFRIFVGSRAISVTGYSPVELPPVVPPYQYYCQRDIGDQTWMCKNYDAVIPGSKVYNNDEANRAIYGGLYSLAQIREASFVPAGWRVPTRADWQQLVDYLGGLSVSGGILKETGTDHWTDPNNGATDDYLFTALPGGYYDVLGFDGLGTDCIMWMLDSSSEAGSWVRIVHNDAGLEMQDGFITGNYLSVRLIKTTPGEGGTGPESITVDSTVVTSDQTDITADHT